MPYAWNAVDSVPLNDQIKHSIRIGDPQRDPPTDAQTQDLEMYLHTRWHCRPRVIRVMLRAVCSGPRTVRETGLPPLSHAADIHITANRRRGSEGRTRRVALQPAVSCAESTKMARISTMAERKRWIPCSRSSGINWTAN